MRIGIIGCGRIADRHVQAYRRIPGVTVAVADQDVEIAKRFAEARQTDWRASPEALLTGADIDAVDVCVPTRDHAPLVSTALRAGKPVFCEKPLCTTLAEAVEIRSAQQETGSLLMVGYLYRFHPALQSAKQVLDDGIIGRPHLAIFRLGGRGSHRVWKHTAEDGGGVTLEMMVHHLDLIQWLLGPAELTHVASRATLLPERCIDGRIVPVTAADNALVRLEAGGAEVVCQSDMVTPAYMHYVDIQGDNGSLFTSILHYLPTIVYCREPRGVYNAGNTIQHFAPVNLFERELSCFIQALRGESAPVNGIEDSLRVLKLVESIQTGGGQHER